MTDVVHVVLDETAILAAGYGNRLVSRLIHRAHTEHGWVLYAPSCALVEADRARPGLAEHLASLPGVIVADLNLPAALAVAQSDTWAMAHAQYTAQPSPDRPDGALVATAAPNRWEGWRVRLLDVAP